MEEFGDSTLLYIEDTITKLREDGFAVSTGKALHPPEIMLPHDLARATIWECGKEFWPIGNEVGDCWEAYGNNRGCGGKNNGHPVMSWRGKDLFYELPTDEDRKKVTKAFFLAHFLYGHDDVMQWNTDGQSFPVCSYCFTNGPWSPQDEYIKEYKKRQNPNWDINKEYEKYKYERSPGKDLADKNKEALRLQQLEKIVATVNTNNMSLAEFVKADEYKMRNLTASAKQGFKDRFAQMNQIFERENKKFTDIKES